MINAKYITVTFSQDKVLLITPRCLKVILFKSFGKDDSSDIYFCLSNFCGSPAMKDAEVLRQPKSNLPTPLPPALNGFENPIVSSFWVRILGPFILLDSNVLGPDEHPYPENTLVPPSRESQDDNSKTVLVVASYKQ